MKRSLEDVGGWPPILDALLRRQDLNGDQAAAAFATILRGEATNAQIAAFITLIHAKGETVEELLALVHTMLNFAEPVTLGHEVIDTCGTGGTRQRQVACFNVSTVSALVIAGAGGKVAKHGGRAASSTSGSADLLEACGVAIELGADGLARCVDEAGIGFCFAPRFHPAARHAGPVRRELRVSSVFNVVNPLSNPARPARQVVGVGTPLIAERVAEVLGRNGAAHVLAVCGHDGLDELTLTGPTYMVEWRDGETARSTVTPADVGLMTCAEDGLAGGDVQANLVLARDVLDGKSGPHRDVVLLNAAAGLFVGGLAKDLRSGVEQAARSIDGGSARDALDRLVSVSTAAAAEFAEG